MNPFDANYLPDEAIFEILDSVDDDQYWHDVDNFRFQNTPKEVYGSMEDEYIHGVYEPTITERHEEIKNAQKEKAKSYSDKKPSKTKKVSWIYVKNPNSYKDPTDYSGKWLIFEDPETIDEAWEQVKYGIQSGILGGDAKVSTKRVFNGGSHVICVYTYNWKDEEDVMRIRSELRELGFEKPLSYKSDEDTLKGKYAKNGHRGISKYYE